MGVDIYDLTNTDQYNMLRRLHDGYYESESVAGKNRDQIIALILLKLLDSNPLEAVVAVSDLIDWYHRAVNLHPELENERINGGVRILSERIKRGGEHQDSVD